MEFRTLVEAAAHWAEHTPDKACLIDADSGRCLTYLEFWRKALAFGGFLRESGLAGGDRAVVRVTQSIDTVVAAFGVYMAGGIHVPIAKKIGDQRIRELLAYFEARLYIAETPVKGGCAYVGIDRALNAPACEAEPVFPDPGEISDIIFTTGTTGSPKGVMRSYGSYCASPRHWSGYMGFRSRDVNLTYCSQNAAGGISSLRRSFLVGSTYVFGNGIVFLRDFFGIVEKYGVTVLCIRPPELSMLLHDEEGLKRHCGGIRAILLNTAAPRARDTRRIKELLPNARVFSSYGATEALGIAVYEVDKREIIPFYAGKPAEGAEIRIADKNGAPMENAGRENPGYIACKTATAMKGYWKNPALTEKVVRDGWVILSDIGYIGNDGAVYLLGREGDIINTGGYKVAPGEIEELALETEGVAECVCFSVPDAILGSIPKLLVVMEKNAEFSAKKIHDHLALKLEAYKLPRSIESADALPKTGDNAKIRKGDLR